MQTHPATAPNNAQPTPPLDPNQRHPAAIGAKLCVECAHAVPQRAGFMKCAHPQLGFSPVSGLPRMAVCADVRSPRYDDPATHCGEPGHWFTQAASAPQCPAERN